jgi:hypothetical protein
MQNTYILDIRLQELVAAVNEILLEVKTWYWYDAQYITGLWQGIGGLTRDNEKSCGYPPALCTVQGCVHSM